MDYARLIRIVENHEELYNLNHPYYSNQVRRDIIWEEIGSALNQTSNACRERWTKIRDNHRKALNLRKAKSDQGVSKLKPPKYAKELAFMAPYLNDEEEQHSSPSPVNIDGDGEVKFEVPTDQTNLDNNHNQSDPMTEFFLNMARTVKTFPLQDQIIIKSQLFHLVNSVELRLAFSSKPPVPCFELTGSPVN